jgi:hypothetical protein
MDATPPLMTLGDRQPYPTFTLQRTRRRRPGFSKAISSETLGGHAAARPGAQYGASASWSFAASGGAATSPRRIDIAGTGLP